MRIQDNKVHRYIYIILLIAGTSFLGHTIDIFNTPYAALYVGIGFSTSIYYLYGKEAFVPLFIGMIIGHPILDWIFFQEDTILSVVYGTSLVAIEMISILFFYKLMKDYLVQGTGTVRNILVYVGVVLFVSTFYSIFASTFYMVIFNETNFFFYAAQNFVGTVMGILIIGGILINAVNFEMNGEASDKPLWMIILFLLVSFLIMFLFLYPSETIFHFFSYSVLILAIIFLSTVVFGFKVTTFIVVGFIVLSNTFFIPNVTEDPGYTLFVVNLFLVVAISLSSTTRIAFVELKKKQDLLENSNVKLEDMIDATFSLLKLGEEKHFKSKIADTDYLTELFQIALTIFKNYDRASCYIRGEEFVEFIAATGYDTEVLNNFKFRIEDFRWDLIEPIIVSNSSDLVKVSLKDNYNKYIERTNVVLGHSILFCFYLDNGMVGGMSFDIDKGSNKQFVKSDFENYKSFQRIMNSFHSTRSLINKNNTLRNDIVLSLIRTLELYDQYTGGHSEEVAYLSMMLAERMNLTEEAQGNCFWAGIVHDIGKVGIPSEILNKPGRLSLEEYDTIKMHPGFGYEILKRSEDLHYIADLVKHHHEWWNGSGYPDGIKGESIPLEARIIGVCDAVSSMATKRPYTEIKTSKEIIKELETYSGTQFEPGVAQVMVDFIKEGHLDKFYMSKDKS